MIMLAIVGCDGAGKSSVVRSLKSRLGQQFQVRQIDKWDVLKSSIHPQYRFLVQDLPALRRCVSDMPEVTRTLFLFWMLHGTLTPQATAGAEVVILDGYWPKHAASELLHSAQPKLVEMLCSLMPTPDLTLFLDVAPEVAYQRRIADVETPLVPYECGLDPACSHSAFLRHQAATRAIMLEWCSRYNWTRIDANLDLALVQKAVFDSVNSLLLERQLGALS